MLLNKNKFTLTDFFLQTGWGNEKFSNNSQKFEGGNILNLAITPNEHVDYDDDGDDGNNQNSNCFRYKKSVSEWRNIMTP